MSPDSLRYTIAKRLRLAGEPLETRKALMHQINGDIAVHYSRADAGEWEAAAEMLTLTLVSRDDFVAFGAAIYRLGKSVEINRPIENL